MSKSHRKILNVSELSSWRARIPAKPGSLAIVCGNFTIIQPGNLAIIKRASEVADRLCVVIEPDAASENLSASLVSPEIRAEVLSHFDQVSAVVPVPENMEVLSNLQPYILFDCDEQAMTPSRQIARKYASESRNISAIPGCFTVDITEAIQECRVPISVPSEAAVCPSTKSQLRSFVKAARNRGATIVTVNGCFDILHVGHLQLFAQARAMGDELIVLINDDDSVHRYKGRRHPVFPVEFRLHALTMLESVSFAYPFSGDNPLDVLEEIKPDIHVKGGTFEEDRVQQEQTLLESWGGKVEFVPMVKGYSTRSIIRCIKE